MGTIKHPKTHTNFSILKLKNFFSWYSIGCSPLSPKTPFLIPSQNTTTPASIPTPASPNP